LTGGFNMRNGDNLGIMGLPRRAVVAEFTAAELGELADLQAEGVSLPGYERGLDWFSKSTRGDYDMLDMV
jgi:hypothetical protein